MALRSKAPKQRRSGAAGDAATRWVAKVPRKEGAPGSGPTEPTEATLEQFGSDWPPLPDATSASNADYYFNSYAHFGIHEDMLKDQVRTGAYMKAIVNNKQLFKDKVVLDVGSGTGILCLFAAKAGAKRCIGIECSDIAEFATKIAEDNGFGDIVTYVQGKVEEVELPVEKVDIIVSEWMGYFLIYESMLDSVLFARDKWLTKDGLLFPDRAKLLCAGIEDADYKEEKIGFWSHVWGFDFSPMRELAMQEPISDTVDGSALATDVATLLDLDLKTCAREDLDFLSAYSLKVQRTDFLHALVVWFDVVFSPCTPPVLLSTAPGREATHWKQTVLYFDDAIVAHKGDRLSGMLAVRKTLQNPRDLDVKVSYDFEGKVPHARKVQYYRLR